jgi:uncharacterized protein (TIGR02231 family)
MLNFLDDKLKKNYSLSQQTEIEIRSLRKQINALERELRNITGPARKVKRVIEVDLEILEAADFNLEISYLVGGAFWQPIYDARVNFETAKVELASYAIIKQNTGEKWENIKLSVSTAKPAIGGRMPYVDSWLLSSYQERREYDRLSKRQKAAVPLSQYRAFEEEGVGIVEATKKDLLPAPEEKGIAVVYQIPKKVTILPDGSEHKLPISTQSLEAKFKYSSYPRKSIYAYLGSRVKNHPKLQLLKGRVNIFLDDDFVGQSSIDNIGPGEEFDLYLGVDENIKIKRQLIEKKIDDVLIGGIPAPTTKITYKYKLSVENYKSKDAQINLFEAIPVSQDERIKVKFLNVSMQPKEKDWDDRKGIWKWEFNLKPKEKKEIIYTFIVEHPRNLNVIGL